ncbi:hypothetical protein [Quatrionicoccus australiensis]|uniref:hypothetical protein n=1 Tax=Quatrionicoccus australiensis TaxID=138118 RepID=UPI001CF90D82|nr:hypothetical protein [Quatrionicoccus australiensis]UCV16116.1 hypothetical protein KI612_05275 [Quatrionicoccus australiensis]
MQFAVACQQAENEAQPGQQVVVAQYSPVALKPGGGHVLVICVFVIWVRDCSGSGQWCGGEVALSAL